MHLCTSRLPLQPTQRQFAFRTTALARPPGGALPMLRCRNFGRSSPWCWPLSALEMHQERNSAAVIGPEILGGRVAQRSAGEPAPVVVDVSSAERCVRLLATDKSSHPRSVLAASPVLSLSRRTGGGAATQSTKWQGECRNRPESHELARQSTAGELACISMSHENMLPLSPDNPPRRYRYLPALQNGCGGYSRPFRRHGATEQLQRGGGALLRCSPAVKSAICRLISCT
ncbi:hypothetical protein K458DRAFT_484647 [Lentithecium fluviatile CBS 122367]|uniref:Uncharacterized protein n=1 Tax=Lentithecium fluviatile CBS 122367 TaxID=1168545 RepID=A0A6G1JDQ3_9PLEO|nr:hypothetical protein K458DRAFT_484647 [Lentithecium fluviatile CBS 122367]